MFETFGTRCGVRTRLLLLKIAAAVASYAEMDAAEQ